MKTTIIFVSMLLMAGCGKIQTPTFSMSEETGTTVSSSAGSSRGGSGNYPQAVTGPDFGDRTFDDNGKPL